jgi:Uma2 family endonuclease
MTITNKLMTADELLRLPDDNMRHELVRGELQTMPPSGAEHGEIILNISGPLHEFVKRKKLGKTYGAETGFIIETQPDTVLAPDVSFVSKDRIPPSRPKGFFEGFPDLAVEVRSPSETAKKVQKKVEDWIDAGTSVVWVIDPKTTTVTVHQKSGEPLVLEMNDELDGGDVVPGFSVPVAEIFGG